VAPRWNGESLAGKMADEWKKISVLIGIKNPENNLSANHEASAFMFF
jgi:hypothetical protein